MTDAGKHLGLEIGIVSNREDPDKLGRVKVRYPTFGDIESDWARVVAPYGGKNGEKYGYFWVPEEGDEVLVGFPQGNRSVPIILGSIYSSAKKPPSEEVDERVQRSRNGHTILISDKSGEERIEIKTKAGQHVIIDEESKTITVKSGEVIEVNGPKKVTLKTDGDQHMTIDADAKTITIKSAQTVVVEAAQDATIKAQSATIDVKQDATIKAQSATVDAKQDVKIKATNATIDATKIELGGAGASEAAILGDTFVSMFNSHTHPVPSFGTSGTPVPPLVGPAVLSKKTKLSG